MNAYELLEKSELGGIIEALQRLTAKQAKRIEELEADFKKLFWMLDEKNKQLHKELSDEEILKLYWRAGWDSDEDVINFAKAIIKASRGEE